MAEGDWAPLTPAQQRVRDEAVAAGGATVTRERPPAAVAGASIPPPPSGDGEGVEVEEITGAHLAEMRAKDEGFSGALDTKDGPTGATPMPATPQEAIQIIERLTNEKLRAETERDAACAECEAYYQTFGPLPEDKKVGLP